MEPIYFKDLENGSWSFEKDGKTHEYFCDDIDDEYFNGFGTLEKDFEKYNGYFEDGLYHGTGTLETEEFIYEGIFNEGVIVEGKAYNGYEVYNGQFKNRLFHGKGELKVGCCFYDGLFDKGNFVKGKITDELDDLVYEGEYDYPAGEFSGFGRLIYGDGQISYGEFKNGSLNGIGVSIYSSGETSVGIHKNGSSNYQKNNIILSSLKSHYLFVHTKGNGVPSKNALHTNPEEWPRLIQIGWILYEEDGTEITRAERIIKPDGFIISKEASAIHGISQEKAIQDGKNINSVLIELKLILSNTRYIGGHDSRFIKGMVVSETIRNYTSPVFNGKEYICTKNGRLKDEKYKDAKLSLLYKNLEYKFDESKSALSNAIASGEFYWKIKKRFKHEISSTAN